jgi:hypothetical protein
MSVDLTVFEALPQRISAQIPIRPEGIQEVDSFLGIRSCVRFGGLNAL